MQKPIPLGGKNQRGIHVHPARVVLDAEKVLLERLEREASTTGCGDYCSIHLIGESSVFLLLKPLHVATRLHLTTIGGEKGGTFRESQPANQQARTGAIGHRRGQGQSRLPEIFKIAGHKFTTVFDTRHEVAP